MKLLTVPILILFLVSLSFSQEKTDLDKLVATERAFARAAAERSTKEAFLEYLADDAIVFEPGPVNGKEVWTNRPPSVGLLSWEPVWADISADGSVGYTTGPWDFRPKGKDGDPIAFGEYVTIWKKQKDGNFKAILDIGISHGKPEGPSPELRFPVDVAAPLPTKRRPSVLRKEPPGVFAVPSRIYRDGEFLISGEEILRRIASERRVPEDGVVCGGAEGFAFCYGKESLARNNDEPKNGNFLRIYKYRNDKWQIVLDLFAKTPSN